MEIRRYNETWDFIVRKVHYHVPGKRGYYIESVEGDMISFSPYQSIISVAKPGGRIVKQAHSNRCLIISGSGDTTSSRVYSPTCDKEIDSIYK